MPNKPYDDPEDSDSGRTRPALDYAGGSPIPSFAPKPPHLAEEATRWFGKPAERRMLFANYADQHGWEAHRLLRDLTELDAQMSDLAELITSWNLRIAALERLGAAERSDSEEDDYIRLVKALPVQLTHFEDLKLRRKETRDRITHHQHVAADWRTRAALEQ